MGIGLLFGFSVENCACASNCLTVPYLKQVCEGPRKHVMATWSSQPVVKKQKKMNLADLMLGSAVTLSGNNFGKVALLFRFANVAMVSRSSFFRIQSHCVVPVVNKYWEDFQDEILNAHRDKDLVIAGKSVGMISFNVQTFKCLLAFAFFSTICVGICILFSCFPTECTVPRPTCHLLMVDLISGIWLHSSLNKKNVAHFQLVPAVLSQKSIYC